MPKTSFFRRIKHWANRSLQRKLIFYTIGFWVFSISVLSLTFLRIGQAELINETRQRNVQLASIISRDVNAQVSSIHSDIRVFARRLEESGPDATTLAADLITLRLSAPQRYRSVYYFDSSGNLLVYCTDPLQNLVSMDPSVIVDRPPVPVEEDIAAAYRMADSAGIYFSDVHFTPLDHTPVIYASITLNFTTGEKSVVVIEIDLRDIWRRIDLSTIGNSGFTYAVSGEGIITHRDVSYIGKPVPEEIRPVLAGYEGFVEYVEPSGNRSVFAAYSPVGGPTGWGIIVEQDRAEAQAPIYRMIAFVVGTWIALALIGTVSILLMIRNLTRPITQLTETTQRIAHTGNLVKTGLRQRPDEIGRLAEAFDRMIDRLQTTEGRLATAAADERNRLARDLHDAVSQTLFSASLIAEVLPRIWERNPEEGRKRLEEVRQLTRGALAEMRTLLLELRPAALAEAELGDLLRQLGESITGRSRVPVVVTTDGQCQMPTEVKIALYRTAQESLNNVAKHAQAKQAKVELVCLSDEVTLKISDNGKGFDMTGLSPDSLGLGIMRERAKGIGATLTIDSKKGEGTQVTVVWKNTNGE